MPSIYEKDSSLNKDSVSNSPTIKRTELSRFSKSSATSVIENVSVSDLDMSPKKVRTGDFVSATKPKLLGEEK